MSYAELRKQRESVDGNTDRHDFRGDLERFPMLHSGFTEACPGDHSKSVLTLSIYFSNGSYRVRVQDRARDEKAFLDVGTLSQALDRLEEAIAENALDWTPDIARRSGRFGT